MQAIEFHKQDELPSNRSFGLIQVAFFMLLGSYLFFSGKKGWFVSFFVSGLMLVITATASHWLTLPNKLWKNLSMLLHHITSPIIMGIVFYLVMCPVGLFLKVFSRPPLSVERDPHAGSYWLIRPKDDPSAHSIKNQF